MSSAIIAVLAIRKKEAYKDGQSAFRMGNTFDSNPCAGITEEFEAWSSGWKDAERGENKHPVEPYTAENARNDKFIWLGVLALFILLSIVYPMLHPQ